MSNLESEAESSGVVDNDPGDESMGTRESVLTAEGGEEDSTDRERNEVHTCIKYYSLPVEGEDNEN